MKQKCSNFIRMCLYAMSHDKREGKQKGKKCRGLHGWLGKGSTRKLARTKLAEGVRTRQMFILITLKLNKHIVHIE